MSVDLICPIAARTMATLRNGSASIKQDDRNGYTSKFDNLVDDISEAIDRERANTWDKDRSKKYDTLKGIFGQIPKYSTSKTGSSYFREEPTVVSNVISDRDLSLACLTSGVITTIIRTNETKVGSHPTINLPDKLQQLCYFNHTIAEMGNPDSRTADKRDYEVITGDCTDIPDKEKEYAALGNDNLSLFMNNAETASSLSDLRGLNRLFIHSVPSCMVSTFNRLKRTSDRDKAQVFLRQSDAWLKAQDKVESVLESQRTGGGDTDTISNIALNDTTPVKEDTQAVRPKREIGSPDQASWVFC